MCSSVPDLTSVCLSSEFEAAAGGRDERCTSLLRGGDAGGGERRRPRVPAAQRSRDPLGRLRSQELGAAGERTHPGSSPQGPGENLQTLLESLQEGQTEELLRGPAGPDRILQWVGVLKVRTSCLSYIN